MLFLIIAVILAKKGHSTGAWVTYVACLVLNVLSTIGQMQRYRYLYGRAEINMGGLIFSIAVFLIAFFIILGSDGSAVQKKKYVTFGLVTAEKIFESYANKEDFKCMEVVNPYHLVNKLNDISEALDGAVKNDSEATGRNIIEHYAYLYDRFKDNGNDASDAASALEVAYNNSLDSAYVNGLALYVQKHMK